MEANKCALVTGSSNGIGEAIVKRLAKLDYNLVVTGRSASDVARVASECASLSPSSKKVSGTQLARAQSSRLTPLQPVSLSS